jgi:hypothetical protein
VVHEELDIRRTVDDDVIVTDGKRRDEMITRIINVYDQRHMQYGDRPA